MSSYTKPQTRCHKTPGMSVHAEPAHSSVAAGTPSGGFRAASKPGFDVRERETARAGANTPPVYGRRRRGELLRPAGWRNGRENRAAAPARRPHGPRERRSAEECATPPPRRAGAGVVLAAAVLAAFAALFATPGSAEAQLPRVTIHDLTVDEPASGTKRANVRVSLDRAAAAGRQIQINFRYVSGTAVAANTETDGDVKPLFFNGSNILIFAPGETETTIPITINGGDQDGTWTSDAATEEFYIDLFNYQHRWVRVAKGRATVTINNVDTQPPVLATGGGVGIPGTFAQLPFTEDLYIGGSRISGDLPASVKNAFTVTADGSDVEITKVSSAGNRALSIIFASDATVFLGQTVRVSYDRDTAGANAIEDVAGNQVQSFTNKRIANGSSASPATAADPLGVRLKDAPRQHDGATPFTFSLNFTDDVTISAEDMRDHAINVTGGTVTDAAMVDGRADKWTITVEPSGTDDVTISVPPSSSCSDAGALCTADRIALGTGAFANLLYVAAPLPALSVADAAVEEGPNAKLKFEITLDRAASETVTVAASTSDGTATAGSDYRAKTLSKTFAPGETRKIAVIAVLDDAHNEGAETLTLTLSNASGARVADGEATGTINNQDPLPRASLGRFGRTAAVHVVEHVEERITARREPGFEGRFAGRELRRGMERDMALGFLNQLGASVGANPASTRSAGAGLRGPMTVSPVGGLGSFGTQGLAGRAAPAATMSGPMVGAAGLAPGGARAATPQPTGGLHGGGLLQMGLGGGDLLTGSAFALNRETRHGGIFSFWSRGARSNFAGRDGAVSLGGDVRTTMFGADYAKGPLVAGLSLSHSRGLGEYTGVTGGQTISSVTGLYPWLGYRATDRITVWGVGGYGSGGLLLTPDGASALESDLSMKMAAAGTRGELVAGGASGFGLAFKADALWVGTSIAGVDGPGGRLAATGAAVTRFRTGLEGSRNVTLAGRMSLKPTVEVGLRHDGGDAETGAGLDFGGGLVLSDPVTGLLVDVKARMLVVHQDEGFRDHGISVSLSYDPTPKTPLGLKARVAPSWGGEARSGAEALWGRETMAGMAAGSLTSGSRFDAEVGYGLPVGSRFVGTPRFATTASEYGRAYGLGYSLGALETGPLQLELGLDAQRRESAVSSRVQAAAADQGVLGRITLRW